MDKLCLSVPNLMYRNFNLFLRRLLIKVRTLIALLLFIVIGAIAATSASSAALVDEPFQPIQIAAPKNKGMVDLGMMLFFDPRLSKSGFLSCNSCHNLSMGGTENLKTSILNSRCLLCVMWS